VLRESVKIRLRKSADLLYAASRKIRILRSVSWSLEVRKTFFRKKAQTIPIVEYPPFELKNILECISIARSMLKGTFYDNWLIKKANALERSAMLISSRGTKDFFTISEEIYGLPKGKLKDGRTTPLDLVVQFQSILDSFQQNPVSNTQKNTISAKVVADHFREAIKYTFGDQAPKVSLVENLSAKATATSKEIKIREKESFTYKNIRQLINHEALVHVATTLNGRRQHQMKILGANYGTVTKTQEGLAVFSEFITGSMDIARMRRLCYRVVAVQMAIDGADFIDVYRFFLEKTDNRNQSFEQARRVFRGGLLSGGAPFTKDIVYLDGLIRVHNFFRKAVEKSRDDALRLIFSGKIDLDDIPALIKMKKDGLIDEPEYIPPWVDDLNYLICYFSFNAFIDDLNYEKAGKYYDSLLVE
tara:strand:+ start:1042 stop:2292 length:1251 start_codon:yes stop_codon:yes gene_type:complete